MPANSGPQELVAEGERRRSPSGAVLYMAVLEEGREELERAPSSLFWSAFAAGLSMAFSAIAEAFLRDGLPDEGWQPLVAKLGYSVGFLIVILGRQQLFTENTLTAILPLLHAKRRWIAWRVARLWGVVLVANLLGGLIIAWVIAQPQVLGVESWGRLMAIGSEATAPTPFLVLLRAVFAGWLIALIVWLLPFAESGRIAIIMVVTYVIGIGHFPHVIAGAIPVFAYAVAGQIGWTSALVGYLLPTLVGNVIGGVTLVAALNHAQAAAGVREPGM